MTSDFASDSRGLSTTQRVLRVLTLLGESAAPVRVQQLAERAGLPVSTVHRMVNAMVDNAYATYDVDRHEYAVGPQLMRLAGLVEVNGPATILRPYLQRLSDRFNETVMFNLYLPDQCALSIVLAAEGSRPLRYSFELGKPMSLGMGASGKSVLAHLDDAVIRKVWEERETQSARGSETFEDFTAELRTIRARGWAASRGERIQGARAVASVVQGSGGTVVGGICITFPEDRVSTPIEELGAAISATAREVSQLLGAP